MVSGLTPTQVLRYIRRALGAHITSVEFSDAEIMKIVNQQSLPLFSEYFPYKPCCTLNPNAKVAGTENVWRIPNAWGLQITGAYRVITNQYMYAGTGLGSFIPNINPFIAQMTADIASWTQSRIVFEWLPPNAVRVMPSNLIFSDVVFQFLANHPRHLKTIDVKQREEFCLLCLYDVLLSIKPIRKRFATISTAYGSLEPFNEMIDSAESNRNDLLSKWTDQQVMAADQMKIIVA